MVLNPRKAKLLEELPKNNWKVEPSALKAGYSKSYARKQQKVILKSALKDQAKEALEMAGNSANVSSKDIKKELIELLGLSRQDLFKRLKYIGFEQDKDLHTALKVLAVLGREAGFHLEDEAPKTIVPVLNIGVTPVTGGNAQMIDSPTSIDGLTEP